MDFLDLQPKPLISEQLGHQIISMKLQSEAPQSHCDVEQPDSFTYLHSFKGFFAHNFFPGISRDSRDCPLNFPFPGNCKMGGKLETLFPSFLAGGAYS